IVGALGGGAARAGRHAAAARLRAAGACIDGVVGDDWAGAVGLLALRKTIALGAAGLGARRAALAATEDLRAGIAARQVAAAGGRELRGRVLLRAGEGQSDRQECEPTESHANNLEQSWKEADPPIVHHPAARG